MARLLKIFPIAEAQSIVATSQPTWGSISNLGQTTQNSSIILAANNNNVAVGNTFKVTVEIKTNNNQINEYRIFLKFDSTKLKVVDQDINTPGTQIKLLDQLFTITNPGTDNLVTNDEIKLIAKTQSNNAFQVNRIVAEIEFQAQSPATTTISIVQGSGKTALIRANGTSLNFSTNSQIINILSQTSTQQQTTTNTYPSTQIVNTSNNNNNNIQINEINQIPSASFRRDEITYLFIFTGFILILISLKINKKQKKY